MDDLISIIIPIYNVEIYLDKCLDSVINQTYKNLEIILVDDGSTDGSGKICDEYSKKDKRIKVFHKENGGVSSARNVGLNVANGAYISFIDPDDWIEKKFIENLYFYATSNTMVCCGLNRLKSKKKVVYRVKKLIECDKIQFLNYLYYFDLKVLKEGGINTLTHGVCNKLFPSWIFWEVRFPKGKTSEDIFIILKLVNKINNFVIIPTANYNYRERENSCVASINKKNLMDYLDATLEQEKDIGIYDNLLKTARLLTVSAAITVYAYNLYEFYKLNKSEIKILKNIINERKKYIPNSFLKLRIKIFLMNKLEFLLKLIYKLKKHLLFNYAENR